MIAVETCRNGGCYFAGELTFSFRGKAQTATSTTFGVIEMMAEFPRLIAPPVEIPSL
jgi:hypothetical protein